MRLGLSRDLGFTGEDRSENLRRAAEAGKLLNNSGLICVMALIAPSESVRQRAAKVVGEEKFVVVHLDPPAEVSAERDNKKEDIDGERSTPDFQKPENADLVLDTSKLDTVACVDKIVQLLESRSLIA